MFENLTTWNKRWWRRDLRRCGRMKIRFLRWHLLIATMVHKKTNFGRNFFSEEGCSGCRMPALKICCRGTNSEVAANSWILDEDSKPDGWWRKIARILDIQGLRICTDPVEECGNLPSNLSNVTIPGQMKYSRLYCDQNVKNANLLGIRTKQRCIRSIFLQLEMFTKLSCKNWWPIIQVLGVIAWNSFEGVSISLWWFFPSLHRRANNSNPTHRSKMTSGQN